MTTTTTSAEAIRVLGPYYKTLGNVTFELHSLAFMLGQTAAVAQLDKEAAREMIDERRGDLRDFEQAASDYVTQVSKMIDAAEASLS